MTKKKNQKKLVKISKKVTDALKTVQMFRSKFLKPIDKEEIKKYEWTIQPQFFTSEAS